MKHTLIYRIGADNSVIQDAVADYDDSDEKALSSSHRLSETFSLVLHACSLYHKEHKSANIVIMILGDGRKTICYYPMAVTGYRPLHSVFPIGVCDSEFIADIFLTGEGQHSDAKPEEPKY